MYAEQWEDYRKRRLMFWCVYLGGGPVALTITALLSQVFTKEIVDRVFFILGGAWWLGVIVTGYRLMGWRCPRCDNYYFVGLIRNPFARQCQHCGLKKWDEGETEKDERFYSK